MKETLKLSCIQVEILNANIFTFSTAQRAENFRTRAE